MEFEFDILKLIAAITIVVISLASLLIVVSNAFFNQHYLKFHSPVVLQSPVTIHDREPKIIEVNNSRGFKSGELEASSSGEKKGAGKPSPLLVAHTKKRPGVYGKIVRRFGSKSILYGELLARESSLNPTAINPNSGACGLVQALPCSKLTKHCSLSDVNCQLDWLDNYINNRYGSINKALAFHDEHGWY